MKRIVLFLAMCAGIAMAAPAWGQVPESELSALKARLDALEAQNAELRSAVQQQQQQRPQYPVATPAPYNFAPEIGAPPVNNEQLRSIVEEYMSVHSANLEAMAAEAAAAADKGHEVGSDLKMTGSWNNGLEFATKNKDFRVHIGGRTQFDAGWFNVDPNVYNQVGGINTPTPGLGNVYGDGVDVRRARLRIDGTMYEVIDWAAEYDFVNSAAFAGTARTVTAPTDLWWQIKELPFVQNIKIGNQKEAIGFEHMVSSRFQPFMERSYNQDTFYGGLFNGFQPGITCLGTYGEDEIGTYNIGVFKPTNNVFAFNTGDGDYSLTGRMTYLMWYEDDGRQLLHIGGSLRQATATSTNVGAGSTTDLRSHQFRTRDAIRTGLSANWPTPANITLFGDDEQTANAELVMVNGSFTMQAEYLVNALQDARLNPLDPLGNTAVYHGGYVQCLYFLTGESDSYSKKTGFFERVKPAENFFLVKDSSGCNCFGRGAWQIGARYNYLDLNDAGLNGGVLHNVTVGLNWFLNPNMKVQWNYMATHRDAPLPGNTGDGLIQGFGMRLAHDF
ncbi:OprO/OprP family phosphate-selective porin [Anatilimnocola floriformis]|uniref:OprO/OprP family phosphate-selective porin n=1 Tax=Anatilimnocola floriformis TaxID=2948575 RepID=UPI0020C4B24A|nr:porin [Anatilimnocola floriformis]